MSPDARRFVKMLLLSADPSLSSTRRRVLETQGWEVETSRNKQQALALLHQQTYDVLLLCSTLSAFSQNQYLELYRKRNPLGEVVLFMKSDMDQDPRTPFVIPKPATPKVMLEVVRTALAQREGRHSEGAASC
jgi:DNA-binding response OmpR family regulator